MKKWIGILIAVLLCITLPLSAFAEGEGETEPAAQETPLPTAEPADAIEITPVGESDAYKDMLMDSFDQTLLGKNENLRRQLYNILRSDRITVTPDNYKNIIRYVNEAIHEQKLSDKRRSNTIPTRISRSRRN